MIQIHLLDPDPAPFPLSPITGVPDIGQRAEADGAIFRVVDLKELLLTHFKAPANQDDMSAPIIPSNTHHHWPTSLNLLLYFGKVYRPVLERGADTEL